MLRWYEPVWSAFLMSAALKSTVVLGSAWVMAMLLRRRSAAARHLVWTAAAAAVLALPFLSLGLPELRLPVAIPRIAFHTTVTDDAGGETILRSVALRDTAARRPGSPAPWRPDWPLYLIELCSAGTVLALARMVWAGAALARARAKARPYADEDFSGLAEVLGIAHPVPVLESAPGSMPMTFGLLRPAVFLPADAAEWTEDRRRMVVLHELAHVRRGDVASHLLARTALSFYWWNPLAWLAWREFLKEREQATDDMVLRTGARASDYAAHLLEVARAMQPADHMGWAAVAMARRSQLEGRLLAILDSGVNRKTMGRAPALAAAVAAVLLVAPFAAIQAQDQNEPAVPADVDATIRAALAQKNHEMLDNAAAALERARQYSPAQKLLETSLAVREQTSGEQSAEYGEGLAKLGDLAVKRDQKAEAIGFYSRAALAIGDRPAAVHALHPLGVLMLVQKDYPKAEEYFQQVQSADPSQAGESLTWIAIAHEREAGGAELAESYYRQALAVEGTNSPETAVTMNLLARLLRTQGRTEEADQMAGDAANIRKALGAQVRSKTQIASSPGVMKVGGGVSAPMLLKKVEPEYSMEARAAKYQGTVLVYAEIGPDGVAHHLQVMQGLGLGLNEKAEEAIGQWQFKPGMKDGQAVTVAATIEMNFKLL